MEKLRYFEEKTKNLEEELGRRTVEIENNKHISHEYSTFSENNKFADLENLYKSSLIENANAMEKMQKDKSEVKKIFFFKCITIYTILMQHIDDLSL